MYKNKTIINLNDENNYHLKLTKKTVTKPGNKCHILVFIKYSIKNGLTLMISKMKRFFFSSESIFIL